MPQLWLDQPRAHGWGRLGRALRASTNRRAGATTWLPWVSAGSGQGLLAVLADQHRATKHEGRDAHRRDDLPDEGNVLSPNDDARRVVTDDRPNDGPPGVVWARAATQRTRRVAAFGALPHGQAFASTQMGCVDWPMGPQQRR